MVQGIVDVDFIWYDLTLDTKLFPSFLGPDSLTEILSSKMRACGVELGPLFGLLWVGCGREDVFEVCVAQALSSGPLRVGW